VNQTLLLAVFVVLTLGTLGSLAAVYQLNRSIKSLVDKIDAMEAYFSPRVSRVYLDEDDRDGTDHLHPSPFLEDLAHRAPQGAVKVQQKIMVELPLRDPGFKAEILELKNKGDGRWMGVFVEKMYSNPSRQRDLVELQRKYSLKGWRMVSIEPAYDSGDQLCVWLELEKELLLSSPESRAA
jgi:hypothetical protein